MTGTRDRTKTKNNKKMTKKWQKNDRDKWQDKKNDKSKWQKNDNANDKIIIFMYPSVWLQVPSNPNSKISDQCRFMQKTTDKITGFIQIWGFPTSGDQSSPCLSILSHGYPWRLDDARGVPHFPMDLGITLSATKRPALVGRTRTFGAPGSSHIRSCPWKTQRLGATPNDYGKQTRMIRRKPSAKQLLSAMPQTNPCIMQAKLAIEIHGV